MLDGMNIKDIHALLKVLSEKEKELLNQKRFSPKRNLNSYKVTSLEVKSN